MANFPFEKLEQFRQRVQETTGTIFVAGNGGNATVADHFALGMSLNVFRETGRQGRAISLTSGVHMSAAVNDFGYERMFGVQLEAMGRPGDLFIALSASGSSINLAEAVVQADAMGMYSLAIVGKEGPVSLHANESLVIGTESSALSEDMTMMALHWLYGSFMVTQWPSHD
jgi:D-sedoheptulose 7-phosphate isomerase